MISREALQLVFNVFSSKDIVFPGAYAELVVEVKVWAAECLRAAQENPLPPAGA